MRLTDRRLISIKKIVPNKGQISGVPKNPRFIRNKAFEQLKQSLADLPEMLDLREVVVYPLGGVFVALDGNQRWRALKELGWKEIPCNVVPTDWPPEKIRAFIYKTNHTYGEDDMDVLANEFDEDELKRWGFDIPEPEEIEPEPEPEPEPTDVCPCCGKPL